MNPNEKDKKQCPRCRGWRNFQGAMCFNCTQSTTRKPEPTAAEIERMLEDADATEWGFVPPWERKPRSTS